MLKFIDTLLQYTDTTAMKLLYTDTDSFFFATTKPLTELVIPEKNSEWNESVYSKWFVRDPDCIEEIREPGLYKYEAVVTNGSFVALSSKCYSLLDNEGKDSKQALKGINQSTKLRHKVFLSCLYENCETLADQTGMNFSRKHGSMSVIQQQKRALNNVFTKLCVNDDLVSISPLMKNNQFI